MRSFVKYRGTKIGDRNIFMILPGMAQRPCCLSVVFLPINMWTHVYMCTAGQDNTWHE